MKRIVAALSAAIFLLIGFGGTAQAQAPTPPPATDSNSQAPLLHKQGTAVVQYQMNNQSCTNRYQGEVQRPVVVDVYQSKSGNPIDFSIKSYDHDTVIKTGKMALGDIMITTGYDWKNSAPKSWPLTYDSASGNLSATLGDDDGANNLGFPPVDLLGCNNPTGVGDGSSMDQLNAIMASPWPLVIEPGAQMQGTIMQQGGQLTVQGTIEQGRVQFSATINF